MTSVGTFYEGLIIIVLAIAVAVLSTVLKIPWLMTIAPVLFALGLAYMGGGSAGKTEAIRKLTIAGFGTRTVDRNYLSKIVRR